MKPLKNFIHLLLDLALGLSSLWAFAKCSIELHKLLTDMEKEATPLMARVLEVLDYTFFFVGAFCFLWFIIISAKEFVQGTGEK